ncbi:Reverse transcriptase, RNA-dependent DNA polymerase [Cinara cedri]|uniref:Reverse transcriptase, RNA-dependent DNA polymerase n=1 Tax=Cinara cedri TaxID=506608 RepID=A0A5E4NN76_9HEMI|nr:Reverse transcriptase, RNA-dependent DNA polymerase [Cinara cedri]
MLALSAQNYVYNLSKYVDEVQVHPDKNCWKKEMLEEMDALIENNTWTLVPKPQNKRIINNKWIFKLKLDEEGNPLRYKARLVAKGYKYK